MGSLHVRLLFIVYVLLLALARLGHFDAATIRYLTILGLRSTSGLLGWLLAGVGVAYCALWRRRRALLRQRRLEAGLPAAPAPAPGGGEAAGDTQAQEQLDLELALLQAEHSRPQVTRHIDQAGGRRRGPT